MMNIADAKTGSTVVSADLAGGAHAVERERLPDERCYF
jgi:hypothetical protein